MKHLLLIAALIASTAGAAAPSEDALRAKAAKIHSAVLPFDLHVDIARDFDGDAQPADREGPSQFDLVKARRGGLKAVSLALFSPQTARTPANLQAARSEFDDKHRAITGLGRRYPGQVALAHTPADVRRIAASGRLAIVETILNAYPIGTDLGLLDGWISQGVRAVGFTHAGHNDLADSSRPNAARGEGASEHDGLSPIGREAVARLNDAGVVIDVSQLSDKAFDDVLRLTRAPVVATHSDVRARHPAPRNLSDAQLLALKRNGGMVGIVAFAPYLTTRKDPKANVTDLIDAVDHVVKLIGVDHVGLSSDFNHGGGVVGWADEGEAGNVTLELVRRGYSRTDIAKIWGGNYLRIWQQAIDHRRSPERRASRRE